MSRGCEPLHARGCRRFLGDVAMSSRAIPGSVDPGCSRQEPAALTPNKQPSGDRHIPGRSLATVRVQCFLFILIPWRGTAEVVGSTPSRRLLSGQVKVEGGVWGVWKASSVSTCHGGDLCLGTFAASLAQGWPR